MGKFVAENLVKKLIGADIPVKNAKIAILAVSHEQFKGLTVADFDKLYSGSHRKVLVDVKSMLDKKAFDEAGYVYWRL